MSFEENKGSVDIFSSPANAKGKAKAKAAKVDKAPDFLDETERLLAQQQAAWLSLDNPAIWTEV